MHQSLLKAYNNELRYLREVGSEFAKAYPRIGAALGLHGGASSDPMIERLLEGLAFLTARISHRIDVEHGRLKEDLLQCLMPDLLLSLPPMTMVEFKPIPTLPVGVSNSVSRGSLLRATRMGSEDIHFYCSNHVDISPLKLSVLQSPSRAAINQCIDEAVERNLIENKSYGGVLRIELSSLNNQNLAACIPNRLRILCSGKDGLDIWNVLTSKANALLLVDPNDGGYLYGAHLLYKADPAGYEDDESLLPSDCVLPGPTRLLHEWRHYPDKFNFVDLVGLEKSLKDFQGNNLELWWIYDVDTSLSSHFEPDSLKLHCAPVVNLFIGTCEPIVMSETMSEYRIKLAQDANAINNIITLHRVDYRDSQGNWRELTPLSAGFDEDPQYRYSIRSEPHWQKNELTNKLEATWEWIIAPAPIVSQTQSTSHQLLSMSAWSFQVNDINAFIEKEWVWKLDAAAPVLQVCSAGSYVRHSPKPHFENLLSGSLGLRVDMLGKLSPKELAKQLREWLNLFDLNEYSSGIVQATIELATRRIPQQLMPIYARGWVMKMEVDENLATHPRLHQWLQVLVKTLGKQLQSESFVECHFERKRQQLAVASTWK